MSTSLKWRTAEEFFQTGHSLFKEKRYDQALVDLRKAEELFRNLDARGHPRGHALDNGVSGLANTLALLGRCYQELDQHEPAITCFETSLVNEKFERKKPFRIFLQEMRDHVAFSYGQELKKLDPRTISGILGQQDLVIDTSFKFPFSLSSHAVLIARLYELSPDRFPQFKEFYRLARSTDTALRRRAGKDFDETTMKRATVSIWVIFVILWIIYSAVVVKALLK
ncbi:MAG: hypothetical protein A2010_05925 [Nitrospirae bacterium GWD2_57_9]|nr:MAG: hypothetical protein A2010_05925 [Nitrospirae bacterium GWD2_57_9]